MNIAIKHRPHQKRWETHFSLTDPRSIWKDVYRWCWDTFGHPGTDPETEVKSSWDYMGGWIYFYDEKYVTMFALRWVGHERYNKSDYI